MLNPRWKYKCIICDEWHEYGKIYHEKNKEV